MASQTQTEYKKFRQDALSIFDAAVASVCPKQMMTAALKVSENGKYRVQSLYTRPYYIKPIWRYSKTCVNRPLKNRQNKGLNDNW